MQIVSTVVPTTPNPALPGSFTFGGSARTAIPWLMAGARAALGPVLIAGAAASYNPATLAFMVVGALFSDIFDGVLARRWHTDTAALRLSDTLADTVFYLCTAVALNLAHPGIWSSHAVLLGSILALEAGRYAFDLARFGKPASYHSYLAKTWGLVLATAVICTFASSHTSLLIAAALWLGIACNLEGFAMSLMLRTWHHDVETLGAAWHLRQVER